MRKTFILIVSVFIINSLVCKAQTEQGRFIIGGTSTFGLMGTGSDIMSIGVTTVKYKSDADGYEEPDADKMTSFNFIPKVGVFAANNLLIGLDFSIAYQNSDDGEYDYSYSRTLMSVGPYMRYYIPASAIKPFFEVAGSYGTIISKYEDEDDSDEDKDQLTSFGGGFGIAIPIGNNASFDAMAHYTSFTTKAKEDNENNNRMVAGTFGLKLGFVVFLGN